MIFKIIGGNDYSKATHEEIPDEELWEDGEIGLAEVEDKIVYRILDTGDWILVRRIDE